MDDRRREYAAGQPIRHAAGEAICPPYVRRASCQCSGATRPGRLLGLLTQTGLPHAEHQVQYRFTNSQEALAMATAQATIRNAGDSDLERCISSTAMTCSVEESDVRWFDEHLAAHFLNSNPDGTLADRAGFLKIAASHPSQISRRATCASCCAATTRTDEVHAHKHRRQDRQPRAAVADSGGPRRRRLRPKPRAARFPAPCARRQRRCAARRRWSGVVKAGDLGDARSQCSPFTRPHSEARPSRCLGEEIRVGAEANFLS